MASSHAKLTNPAPPSPTTIVCISRHGPKGGAGGHMPPQILADQKAPPAAAAAPHYYVPPQIFRLWTMPAYSAHLHRAYGSWSTHRKQCLPQTRRYFTSHFARSRKRRFFEKNRYQLVDKADFKLLSTMGSKHLNFYSDTVKVFPNFMNHLGLNHLTLISFFLHYLQE